MKFEITDSPAEQDVQTLIAGLQEHAAGIVPSMAKTPLGIFCRQNGQLAGGLTGESYWGWLYIRLLWTHPDQRGGGLGGKLMAAAEAEGVRRGCRYAFVNTFSYQAPEFYQKQGYEVWGILDDFPPGFQRIYLFKNIAPE